jgi:hypothetical protein
VKSKRQRSDFREERDSGLLLRKASFRRSALPSCAYHQVKAEPAATVIEMMMP